MYMRYEKPFFAQFFTFVIIFFYRIGIEAEVDADAVNYFVVDAEAVIFFFLFL